MASSDWEVRSTGALARAAEHPRGGSIAESLSSPDTPNPLDGWSSTGYSRAARAHVALVVLVEWWSSSFMPARDRSIKERIGDRSLPT